MIYQLGGGYARLIDTALMFSASASSPKKFVEHIHEFFRTHALHRGPEVGNVIHVVFVGSSRANQTAHSVYVYTIFYMHIGCCIIYLIAIDTFKVAREPHKVRYCF
jgi:hypothetical protein